MRQWNNKRGVTIVELLVSISIITILLLIAIINYRTGQRRLTLERAAHKLSQDIRKAQEMAMSAEEFEGEVPPGGYGLNLQTEQTSYILFADTDPSDTPDHIYTEGSDGLVETIDFETGIKVKDLNVSPLNIVFTPPDPTVFINPGDIDSATITICLISDESKVKTITVNKAGLINIE